jgi:hypothetical protein
MNRSFRMAKTKVKSFHSIDLDKTEKRRVENFMKALNDENEIESLELFSSDKVSSTLMEEKLILPS